MLLPYIPVIAATAFLLLVIVVTALIVRCRRDRLFHGATMRTVDAMDGPAFELFLAELFQHLGYRVQRVGQSHDFGADLVLTSRRRQHIVVQAKRYNGRVGIAAVQEVLGAVRYYRGTRGMVVTNSDFTVSAEQLAKSADVELWNRERLTAAMVSAGGRAGLHERRDR